MSTFKKVTETIAQVRDSAWFEAVKKATKNTWRGLQSAVSATKHAVLTTVGAAKLLVHVAEAGADTTKGIVKATEWAGKKLAGNDTAGEAGEAAINSFKHVGKDIVKIGQDTFECGSELLQTGFQVGEAGMYFAYSTVNSLDATKELFVAACQRQRRDREETENCAQALR